LATLPSRYAYGPRRPLAHGTAIVCGDSPGAAHQVEEARPGLDSPAP
jgi:hypothetical protein